MKRNKINFLFFIIVFLLTLTGLFLLLSKKNFIEIPASSIQQSSKNSIVDNNYLSANQATEEVKHYSSISGLPCTNYNRRPIAVMIANDAATRPLSGLSEADLVVEMQVVTDSVTRLMAVFVCNDPKEIGSVRSARHDFIPLAMGLDAIYAHWGGSHYALNKLNNHIMNNLNALNNPFAAFYRKSTVFAPHNGFTSLDRLLVSAIKSGYRLENQFIGYLHEEKLAEQNLSDGKNILDIGYNGIFRVRWQYDSAINSYFRWRSNTKEIDRNNNKQTEVKNIVVMRAQSRTIEGQYNDVDVEGAGRAEIYNNGRQIEGTWKKDEADSKSKLYFFDTNGQEIKFVPGAIWIEIIEPNKTANWY